MSLPRFFVEQDIVNSIDENGTFIIKLSPEDRKHFDVLRLSAGEHIVLIDNQTDYFEVEIISIDNQITAKISNHKAHQNKPYRLTLLQGLAKADKIDVVLRHATEVGVDEFVPVAFERSVVKLDKKKLANRILRWRAIVKSAAMQSGRDEIPIVEELIPFKEITPLLSSYDLVFLFWEEASEIQTISDAIESLVDSKTIVSIACIVGPEGGISHKEVDTLLALPNIKAVTLGNTILRTETAGIVAPALVMYELNRK